MELYDYQQSGVNEIHGAWNMGARYVLYVLPTGGGKTVVFSSILEGFPGISVAIAHRREILGQISMALATNGVAHSIIGPEKLARIFGQQHREVLGRSWINPHASVVVASVDTLKSREHLLKKWGAQVRLWVQDEGHHVLADNKWGTIVDLFPNAVGLGVTATPLRADGRSLQLGNGGMFQQLVQGPHPRELITRGFLADYRIFAPTSDMSTGSLKIGSSGDFSRPAMAKVAKESHIVGDVVSQYLKFAPGEMGVTFMTDVKTAEATAGHFKLAGVPSAALSAQSKDSERTDVMRAFRSGEIQQLVNVDLFGEGFDLPTLQVVSFGRPTASYGLYCQQFGRALRRSNGKTHGKIIDQVGNVARHGLPDKAIRWSLGDGRAPSEDMTGPPLRTCEQCLRVWEGYSRRCPHCGFVPKISARSLPEQVDGDLAELDPSVLATMRGEVDRVDLPVASIIEPLKRAGASREAIGGLSANHRKRQKAQAVLRETMALWGGYAKASGLSNSARQIKFYREFGVDVLSAQALGRPPAEELASRVGESINQF